MKALLQQILQHSTSSFDTVAVIGAGNGDDLPAIRRLKSKRLILAEPHPHQVETLSRLTRPERGEQIRPIAITPSSSADWVELNVCNNLKYCSLESPLELTKIAPNLRTTGQLHVPAQSFQSFLTSLNLTRSTFNLLILDTPGQNAKLLQAVTPELLHFFSWIILQGSEIPNLYYGDLTVMDTARILETFGFELSGTIAEILYPHAAISLRRSDILIRTFFLEKDLIKLQKKIQQEVKLSAENQAQIVTLTHEREEQAKRTAKSQEALEVMTRERDALAEEKTRLAKEKDARISQLEAHGAKLEGLQQMLQEELEKAEVQIDLIKDLLLREPEL